MQQVCAGSDLEVVDRGPDWLFVNVHATAERFFDASGFADDVWNILNRHFIYRVVLEMGGVKQINSELMGQLVKLQKRVLQHDGALRLCGLSSTCQDALKQCRLGRILPNYETRADAVQAHRIRLPR